MSFINHHSKEINLKVVYYGPGLGGKTSNIQYIYQKSLGQNSSKLYSLNTKNERTLFFDFLPLSLGKIRNFKTRLHLYTVPGQSFYDSSRKLILRGVDGIVFVADSQVERMEANIESLNDLKENLETQGIEFKKIPLVVQWNKRDLPNISKVSELRRRVVFGKDVVEHEAVAVNGEGVFETLKSVSKMILINIKGGTL